MASNDQRAAPYPKYILKYILLAVVAVYPSVQEQQQLASSKNSVLSQLVDDWSQYAFNSNCFLKEHFSYAIMYI